MPSEDVLGQWHIDRLDLDAYLRRISYDGSRHPTAPTLTALHRAHIAAIPFENLDLILGRGVSVELDDIQAKLVDRRRGGYCYEHGLLFGAALERLGFQVDRLLARTGDPQEHPRPRSHMVLCVRADGARWLADVGFGSGLLEPLPLKADGPHRQGGWTFALMAGADGMWRLQERQGADWVTRFSFTEEPQYWVDVDVANYNTATNPRSPFVVRPIVVRKDDGSLRELLGRQFTVAHPDRSVQEHELDDAAFARALAEEFGIEATPAEVAALVATLPPYDAGPQPTAAAAI